MKKKILLAIAVIAVIALLASVTGCTKKTTTTKTTPVVSTTDQRFKTIEANIQSQLDKLNALQTEVGKLKSETNWETYINGVEAKLQGRIDALTLDNTKLKTSLAATLADQDKSILDKLTEVDTKLAAAIVELKNTSVPKYAMITAMGRRYIEITVYGAGNYPVVVYIHGTNLKTGEIEVEEIDDEIAVVTDEQLTGNYSLVPTITPITSAPVTVTSGEAIPNDPSAPPAAHKHSVIVPGVIINGISYQLVFNGNLLVLIIEPDTSWKNGDTFLLDIRDISGSIIFATANVGAN